MTKGWEFNALVMYQAGVSIPEISQDLGVSISEVSQALNGVKKPKRKREYWTNHEPLTVEVVERFRDLHPPGSTVYDETGKQHEVIKSYPSFAQVKDKTILWSELARVAWNVDRGKDPYYGG